MNRQGAPSVAAKFNAAWKSPSLEAPSPKYAAVTVSAPSNCTNRDKHQQAADNEHKHQLTPVIEINIIKQPRPEINIIKQPQ
jgi:hypothetical protein